MRFAADSEELLKESSSLEASLLGSSPSGGIQSAPPTPLCKRHAKKKSARWRSREAPVSPTRRFPPCSKGISHFDFNASRICISNRRRKTLHFFRRSFGLDALLRGGFLFSRGCEDRLGLGTRRKVIETQLRNQRILAASPNGPNLRSDGRAFACAEKTNEFLLLLVATRAAAAAERKSKLGQDRLTFVEGRRFGESTSYEDVSCRGLRNDRKGEAMGFVTPQKSQASV